MPTRKPTKLLLGIAIALLLGGLLYFSPQQYLTLAFIQSKLTQLLELRQHYPLGTALGFAALYIVATTASIPGALLLTLTAGALFGFLLGFLLAILSATIGATLAFLVARYLFDDLVQRKMGQRLTTLRHNFRTQGALYLFSIRLVPIFPFFAVNLLMALTSIKTRTFVIASLLGMTPASLIFVNTGTQLAKLDSVKGLLSPAILASFTLLAVFPYVAKYAVKRLQPTDKPDKK